MKKGVLSLLASIFFLLLFVFISYYYSPFDQASIEEYIDKYGICLLYTSSMSLKVGKNLY